MTTIVGVHGVGNHRSGREPSTVSEALSQTWTRNLARGLGGDPARVELRVAYYAPHLRRGVSQAAGIDPEMLEPDVQRMVLAWVGALGAPPAIAQGRGTLPIRQALDWVARKFGMDNAAVRAFAGLFFGEVGGYLREADSPQRLAARRTVAEAITTYRPRMVIAHSLGSVVAYEALWAQPELTVELLVTLGSPLGMPDVVFDRLDPGPTNGWGHRPPGVRRWLNFADPGDLIAIPRYLSTRFRDIDSDAEASIHAFDFHKVANYLACPAIGGAIASYLDR